MKEKKMAQLELKKNYWVLNGEIWSEDFVKAICPVEYQRLRADNIRESADRCEYEIVRKKFQELAERYDASAKADEQCEVKWKAR
jgi:hypothetical protein